MDHSFSIMDQRIYIYFSVLLFKVENIKILKTGLLSTKSKIYCSLNVKRLIAFNFDGNEDTTFDCIYFGSGCLVSHTALF